MRQKLFYLSLSFISLMSLIGAIVYRFYSLNLIGIIVSLVLAVIAFFIFQKFFKQINYSITDLEKIYNQPKIEITKINAILLFIYFSSLLSSFYLLYISRTNKAIISPWGIISPLFFLFYGITTLSLILISYKKIKNTIFLIMLYGFLSFSVLLIIFKIGYGYDPFIHQATLELIKEKGSVFPKHLYYLGQYSLIILINKITFLPIPMIDKLLVPILASIYIPGAIYLYFKKNFGQPLKAGEKRKKKSLLLISLILFFALTFPFFTITTPQNLSYIFLILTIFFGINSINKRELFLSYLLALTTLLIHPIAGIPAILFLVFLTLYNTPYNKLKKLAYILILFITTISLPLIFLITNSKQEPTATNEELSSVNAALIPFSNVSIPNKDNFILNFIYLFNFNYSILILILAISAIIIAYKKRVYNRKLAVCTSFSISLFISYLLTSQLDFNFLIDYERRNYSLRILTISIMFLMPVFGYIFYKVVERINSRNNFIKISFLIFATILLTTALYSSYPRKDMFFNSRSYSVSSNDIKAVKWIEKDAQSKNYVVLANQQVSVAALWRFGFNRYLKDNIYFYPIPTSGLLYKEYLNMVYEKPTRETMNSAMKIAGATKGYFVLNRYWWAFDKILKEAKMEASSFTQIDNGQIYIFKYQ